MHELPLSVVIPTFKRQDSLSRLLDSLAATERPATGVEIIVVDDEPSEATRRLVTAAGAKYFSQPNRGPAAARQLGWQSARGDRIVFLDDDCRIDPRALVRLDDALSTHDGVGATIMPLNPDSLVAQFVQADGLVDHRITADHVSWLVTAGVAFRRSALEAVHGFDLELSRLCCGEDVDLTLRLQDQGFRLTVCGSAIVQHDHPTRLADVVRRYYRNGKAQPVLSAKHPVHGEAALRTLWAHISPMGWWRRYQGYRRSYSAERSALFLVLRAAMMVPYLAGVLVERRKHGVVRSDLLRASG